MWMPRAVDRSYRTLPVFCRTRDLNSETSCRRHVLSASQDTAMASIALQELAESSLDALKTLQLLDKATTMAERLCQSDQPGLSRPGKHARESLKE